MKHVSVKQLVYKFHELPWVIQREIAKDMGLVPYSEEFVEDRNFQIAFFERLKAKNMIEILKIRLFPDYEPEPETHPCG